MDYKMVVLINTYLVAIALFCVSEVKTDEIIHGETTAQRDSQTTLEQKHHGNAGDGEHLTDHLADIVDLDGEGLRHIQEHLGHELPAETGQFSQDIEAIKNGDDAKGIFYFFGLHDFDKNDKLDGLEIFHALTDYHGNRKPEENGDKTDGKVVLDQEVESLVDDLLQKHDLDNDGYIDYAELMNSNPDSLWNQLGSYQKRGDDQQGQRGDEGTQGNQDGHQQDQGGHEGTQEHPDGHQLDKDGDDETQENQNGQQLDEGVHEGTLKNPEDHQQDQKEQGGTQGNWVDHQQDEGGEERIQEDQESNQNDLGGHNG